MSGPTYAAVGSQATYTANSVSSANNLSWMRIYVSPTSGAAWKEVLANGTLDDCSIPGHCTENIACAGGSCSGSRTWTPDSVGTYYVAMTAKDLVGTCKSDPFLTYPDGATGVIRCDPTNGADVVTVTVQQPKTCSIDPFFQTVNQGVAAGVTFTGLANRVAAENTRLWIEKTDGTAISPAPGTLGFYSGINYYQLTTCSTSTTQCSGSWSSIGLPPGNYIFHCDLDIDPGKCSGNPFCNPPNGCSGPLCTACTGWVPCSDTDHALLCVEAGPNITGWTTWSACNGAGQRSRTRTCSQTCDSGNACSNYFTANCPAGSTCTTTGGGPWTQTESQNCSGQMTGTFFDASDYASCPADPQSLPANQKIAGGTISLAGTASYGPYTTNALGLYTTAATLRSPGSYNLTVVPPAGFLPAAKLNCQGTTLTLTGSSTSCNTQPCETAPTTTHSFGFWRVYGGWWQATGGSVYGGTGVASDIPSTLPANQQYLILRDANGQDGLAANKSGTISVGTNPNAAISVSGWNALSGYSGDDADYNYFTAKMSTYTKTTWDGASQPAYNPGGNGYEIYTHSGNVTMNWSPAAGQKVIYLIDGNVTVSGNITVPTTGGTFMMIVASGTITFNTNVTRVDGWWVGSSLSFPSAGAGSDVQFVGNGSFIGWNSISLNRDGGVLNNSQPAEKFTFRPDLMINAPAPLKESRYIWRQE